MNSFEKPRKIVVLGEEKIGKTSIAVRYAYNKFSNKWDTTINAAYIEKD